MHVLPDDLVDRVRDSGNGSDIEIVVQSDLGPNGLLGNQWLVVTRERVMVLAKEQTGEPVVLKDVAVKDLVEVTAEALVGGGALTANVTGEHVYLVRYTNAMAREFGRAARVLQAFTKEEEPPPAGDDDKTKRCEKCDFPLDHGSEVCPNCVNRARAVKRLLAYIAPYKWLTIVSTVLMLVNQALQLIPANLSKILIDDIFAKAQAAKGGVHGAQRESLIHMLILMVLALIVSRVISVVLGIFQTRITAYLGSKIVHDIRMQLYATLERLTMAFFDKRQTGAVISRVSQDTASLQGFLAGDIQYVASNAVILMMILVVMFLQNWKLAALTILPAPFIAVASTIIFSRVRFIFGRVWHKWSKLHSVMSDSLQGLRVVKAFAQEDKELGRFERRSYDLYQANVQAEVTWGTLLPILWFLLTAGQFIVWYAGGIGVIDAKVTVGTLILFISYINMLNGPLTILTRVWDWVGRCLSAAERVFEIIDSQLEEDSPETRIRLDDIKGHIKVNNLTFGYDKNHPVLHNIDLEIVPGEMIGLVGHSGAGKSTMINLLSRFYVAQEGSIEIDGVDIRDIHLEDLRRQIGIVPQESYLFSGTIAENIAYAKPGATPEEIIRAAKAANAHDFIVNSPDGYETQVGERGQSMSGGERQRIAIARAILHDPRILILDEATSSVDTGTEKQIQEALARLVKNRTTIAIAHRLSTLRHANRLLVLDKGKQAELGTHDELIAKPGGVYAKLVEMQTEMSKNVAVGG